MFRNFGNSRFGNLHSFPAFMDKRLGHNCYRQDTQLTRNLRNDRCGARTGTTTHACCDKQHVSTLKSLRYSIPILNGRFLSNSRICTCSQASGD